MDKVTRQCPQTTTFRKRKESRSGVSNRGPSAYQPNALPPGQTGSRKAECKVTITHSKSHTTVSSSRTDGALSCRAFDFILINSALEQTSVVIGLLDSTVEASYSAS